MKDILPLILPYDDWVNCYTYSSHERVIKAPTEAVKDVERIPIEKHDVIIFDLHGTLVCTHKKYIQWLDKFANRYVLITGPLALLVNLRKSIGSMLLNLS